MNKKIIALTAALALLLTGCAGAPKEKTLILSEPVAETAAPDAPAQMSFEVRKINRLSLEKLDHSGIHPCKRRRWAARTARRRARWNSPPSGW